jgi:shikimate kinase
MKFFKNLLGKNIYLYGPPGSGKSYIAKKLASKLNMPLYDIDDDHLEKEWGMTVADKLKELGDEKFIIEESSNISFLNQETTRKLNKTNTIVSLTGSNPLCPETMNFLKKSGIIVYLDLDKNIILDRANKMKLDRIVGQSTKTLSEILDYRREIYQKYYDIKVIVRDNEDAEVTCNNIIDSLNKDEEHTSTRGEKTGAEFLGVKREGDPSQVVNGIAGELVSMIKLGPNNFRKKSILETMIFTMEKPVIRARKMTK